MALLPVLPFLPIRLKGDQVFLATLPMQTQQLRCLLRAFPLSIAPQKPFQLIKLQAISSWPYCQMSIAQLHAACYNQVSERTLQLLGVKLLHGSHTPLQQRGYLHLSRKAITCLFPSSRERCSRVRPCRRFVTATTRFYRASTMSRSHYSTTDKRNSF